MKKPIRISLIAILTVLVLVAAACGATDEQAAPQAPVGSDDPSALPINSNPDENPDVTGTCLVGEPECNDTAGPGDEPLDLPPPSDTPNEPTPTGLLVDGGLSVSDALTTDAAGVVAIAGFLMVDDKGARLCELLLESFPPQCGGAEVSVTGYEEVLGTPLSSAQGISWTDQYVSLLGEIVDGTFVVDPTIAQ